MSDLSARQCKPCEGGVEPMRSEAAESMLAELAGNWRLSENGKRIAADFTFADFYRTMAFVNAVAWVANQQDHHPDIAFGYNKANVSYTTHAIGGLSENDFICAARIDALMQD